MMQLQAAVLAFSIGTCGKEGQNGLWENTQRRFLLCPSLCSVGARYE